MEPNNLCRTLIVYGSYAPGGTNHHLFADLPGQWRPGVIMGRMVGPDELGEGGNEPIEAWTITFSDCQAEFLTPAWEAQEVTLHNRWQALDRRMGAGWARSSTRWWPAGQEPVVSSHGMIVVNLYVPLKHFPYLPEALSTHKPQGQEVLDIWLGRFTAERHARYFEEHYGDRRDDEPLSEFAGDQGEQWVDHDFMEVGFKPSPTPLDELARDHSWSLQYTQELTRRADEQGLTDLTSFVFLTAGQVTEPRSVHREGVALHYMGRFIIKT